MDGPQRAYDDGMEMAHFQGMEVHEYHGMEVNPYPGAGSDEEKREIHPTTHVYNEEERTTRLHRNLKTRQISMIALGGALGTGLLINTGPTLANAGPGSMIIGYALVGTLCFTVMSAMGEMAAWLPLPSGFTGFAHRFVDPALGFALGWNYWFKYIITTPNNIIAACLVIQFWFNKSGYDGPGQDPAIYVAIILVVIIAINYFGVGVFGEFEFWFSSIKILMLLGLIVLTLCIAAGVGKVDHPTGFDYWSHPGAFAEYSSRDLIKGDAGRFLGFWDVLQSAVFSFLGAELVGVTVGEAANPRKAIPRAVKLTFFRIVFFYLVLILFLGMTVPYDSSHLIQANAASVTGVADTSPFIAAAKIAGFNKLPNALNAFLLVFTLSAANSDLYIATRTLYSLSIEGNAPRIFSHTDNRGVPIYALGLSSAFCCIAFIAQKEGVWKTFQKFVDLVTIFGILTWISILVSHIYFIRARRAQGVPNTSLSFVAPFGLIGSAIALVFSCVITFFNGWTSFLHPFDWKTFIVSYIPIPIYLGMILGYKFIKKSEGVVPEEADLFSGKQRIDDEEAEYLAEEERKRGGKSEKRYHRLYRVTLGTFF